MTSTPKYDMTAYPVQVAVRSQSDGAAVHMVTLPYCDCADFTNRKGHVIETDNSPAVTVCKHLLRALELAGWQRPETAAPQETVTRRRLPRSEAFTWLTSAYLAADLVSELLHAAQATASSASIAASYQLATGEVRVLFDARSQRYTVTLPSAQPVNEPDLRG
jgi:hypothetical protein